MQYAWVLEVRPGYEDEYKKRHDEIWPEMLESLTQAGMRNYTIFKHGLTLFGYFETDDLKKTIAALAASAVDKRWSEWMAPIMKIKVVLEIGDPKVSEEVKPLLPRVEDAFQVFMRELRPSDLEGSAGMYRLKEELLRRVNMTVYPAKVDAVLFKELLVQ